jgi:Protein of unknown function (DUF4239)
MEQEKASDEAQAVMQELWRLLPSIEGQNVTQQTAVDHALTQLSDVTEHRRIRLLQSHTGLPGVLWTVLIVGGVITIVSTCMFGVENFTLHLVQVFAITLLISVVLVAIAEVDRPFQGEVRVGPDGFRYALQSFAKWQKGR